MEAVEHREGAFGIALSGAESSFDFQFVRLGKADGAGFGFASFVEGERVIAESAEISRQGGMEARVSGRGSDRLFEEGTCSEGIAREKLLAAEAIESCGVG
jgi:hypothetical protein